MAGRATILVLLLCFPSLACRTGSSQSTDALTPPVKYTWTQLTERAEFAESYNFPVFVATGRMWAFQGEAIWSSTDGKAWTRSDLPSVRRDVYQADYVLLNETVYALGDNSGNYENVRFKPTVKRTTDFRSWQTISERSNLPGRIFRGVVAFDGKIWVLGGYDGRNYFNDVWNSTDGATWTRVTGQAPWSPRTIGTPVVFNGKMFIIGGGVIDGERVIDPGSTREIWSSVDGKEWTKVTGELPRMSGGSPIVFDGKLWLVGANRDGVFGRSSMVSSDGISWTEEPAPWSPRGGVAVWTHDGKLFMTGGKYSVTENGRIRFIYSDDVWVMTKK